MIIKMDNMSAPSWERAQRLYEKNIELDNRRRKSAQAKVPSDPNIWQQMRENYEAIILEDHTFSEKHNIEHALWQLHYKKIEELRSHYSNAQASGGSNASLSGKGPSRPDRTTKIRLQFKTFLSEATGFYHDLILKIRSKYGLPLGYFSEDSDNRLFSEKDGKKSADLKKGLISCHRCLIYLGDLARYKGLYGEPDSKAREYAAASSYYLQAASLWPSIGNPHHQLAILASYSGDDLVTVYRYFRSLAVDNPCSTARDNLIVAFEKNRQSYCQLHGDVKVSTVRFAGKGRGQEAKLAAKDTVAESATMKGSQLNPRDASKSVCVRFVRLNGILFSRTSMETFGEVLSLFMTGFRDLLSSGLEEEMSFGADAFENGLFFVRLVSILIFTTHNVKRETEGQTYAEIVQRAVLLQHAFTATFEIMGHVVERCEQLRDPYSSYLLPGILVYVEWLACHPDLTSGGDVDEKQATARSNFWNYFVSLMNKLLSIGSLSIDDHDDESCFDNMSKYEEGETGNRLALWEDFELRGFLPIVPAQTILDFSRKHSFGSESHKEKIARVKRVLAAGKVLVAVAKINEKTVSYDSKAKKFVIGVESAMSGNGILPPNSILPSTGDMLIDYGAQATVKFEGLPSNSQLYAEGEDEDEEIVFKPTMMEKQTDSTSTLAPFERVEPQKNALGSSLPLSVSFASAPLGYSPHVSTSDAFVWNPVSAGNFAPQDLQPIKSHSSNWLTEETLLSNSLKDLRLRENGHLVRPEIKENISNFFHAAHMVPNPQSAINNSSLFLDHSNAPEAVVPLSRFDALLFSGAADASVGKPSSALPVGKKNPVARPVRHLGPPPGFGGIPKQVNGPISGLDLTGQNPVLDDYSWLDGYKMTSSTNGFGSNPVNYNSQQITSSAASLGAVSFPFPGKQFPTAHQVEMQKGWPDYDTVEHLKLQNGKQLQQHQQVINGNPQLAPLPEQFQGSVWTGRHFV